MWEVTLPCGAWFTAHGASNLLCSPSKPTLRLKQAHYGVTGHEVTAIPATQ